MKTTLKTWEIEGIWGLVISRVDQSSASGSYLIQNIVVSIELILFDLISLFPFYKNILLFLLGFMKTRFITIY
jgi:hypothetical protein